MDSRVDLINCVKRQTQKLVLVIPSHILLLELLHLLRRRRWVGNLGDEVRSRCFSNAVDEDTQKRNLQENEECDGEAIQNT